MQINQTNIADLFKGFRATFMEEYHAATPKWQQLATKTPSSSHSEKYAWLGSVPGLRELLGAVVIQNLAAHDYTIVNKEFEATVGVKQMDIENDTYGIYSPMFQMMGAAARQQPDDLLASLLVKGFDSASKDYTGSAFFADNKEPQKGKTKFSNKTTKKFSEANFEVARANLVGRKNAEGRSMGLGRKLLLVVCPSDEPAARRVLIADTSANGATNINKGAADLLVLPELESYTAQATDKPWFLLEVGLPLRPLIFQVNKEIELFSQTDMSSDHVFTKHEFLFQAYGRHHVGYGLPELAYGSSGTASA